MSRDDFVVYCSSLNTCREARNSFLHNTSLLANCLEWVQWFVSLSKWKVFLGKSFRLFADEVFEREILQLSGNFNELKRRNRFGGLSSKQARKEVKNGLDGWRC